MSRRGDAVRAKLGERAKSARLNTQVDLRSRRIVGMEALARLLDESEIISPGIFRPLLSHKTRELLFFKMLDQSLSLLVAFRAAHPGLTVAINVDPMMFLKETFMAELLETLSLPCVDPCHIVLELLETGDILNFVSVGRQLRELRAAGIRIATDDVGAATPHLLD